jgi:MFS family permease
MTHSTANMMGMAPREFRIGGVIGTTFKVYFKNIVPFTGIAAVILLPVAVILALAVANQDPRDPTGALAGIGVAMLLGMLLTPISTAIILYSAFQDMRGKGATLGEAISWALGRFVPLFLLGIVYTLGIIAGMIALIIPGYILIVMWAVAIPACVVEKTGPIDSLGRSSELTKGNRWQIFAIILIVGMIIGVIGNIVQMAGAAAGVAVLIVAMVIWQGISQAFNAVLAAVMYHDLRVTKEGGDIDRIASVFD